jgi:chromosome segregation ATPase
MATVAELRTTSASFESFVTEFLDELCGLREHLQTQEAELNRWESRVTRELAERESQWDLRIRQLTQERTHLAAQAEQVRIELQEAREALERRPVIEQRSPEADPDLQTRFDELLEERQVLESELEVVRKRAVELADTTANERRRMAEERAEWSGELRQLRRVLEQQAQVLGGRSEAPIVHRSEPAVVGAAQAVEPAAKDPVLSTVMAQFQSLQRDIKRRRAGKSDGGERVVA